MAEVTGIPPCPVCGKSSQFFVDAAQLPKIEKWRSGELLIQDALPDWPSGLRELLLSGTHPPCFDKLFRPE